MRTKSVLILCKSNPQNDPRPNRMINWLKEDYQVTVLGKGVAILSDSGLDDVPSDRQFGIRQNKLNRLGNRFYKLLLLILRRFDDLKRLIIVQGYQGLNKLVSNQFDIIVVHDVELLPLAFEIANGDKAKTLFDAREYYPREFENNFLWRFLIQPFNKHLCKTYLHKCDKVITISDGIAKEYKKEYGINAEVIMSLPKYHEIEPVFPQNHSVRLIYHGQASPDRQIEKMIEVLDYLDERFSLDLMLVPPSRLHWLYWQKIASMVKKRAHIKIIPPVPMKDIIKVTTQYDIGIFICPPTTFNLQYALPNKFFEYIQARLAVAIGPSVEMQRIVEKYHCGIVASDFDPRTLANELNQIGSDEIMSYKKNSNAAALELNAGVNGRRVQKIVKDLLN